jgi:hypothetical protein
LTSWSYGADGDHPPAESDRGNKRILAIVRGYHHRTTFIAIEAGNEVFTFFGFDFEYYAVPFIGGFILPKPISIEQVTIGNSLAMQHLISRSF